MISSCPVVGDDVLGDAASEYLRSIGAPVPDGMRAYVTGVTVTSDVESLARVELSLVLAKADKKKSRGPWVAVSDRLPPDDGHVLVCLDGSVLVGLCDEDGTFLHAETYRQCRPQPTHWMPLPRGVDG